MGNNGEGEWSPYREPWEWGPTVAQELREQTRRLAPLAVTLVPPPVHAPVLTEDDVRRIFREELDRPPSPLAVTAEDVRRWMR